MQKLANKVALVTGGNSGIGLATAKLYKEQGAQVIITARSKDTFEKAQKEYGAHFDIVQTDVSKNEDLDRLYAHIKTKYGKLDVLFANAGVAQMLPTKDVTSEFFDNQFNTNVKGLFFTVSKALPILSKGSSVVLNSSIVAYKGFANTSIYAATKAAVRSFARTWTAEFLPADVRFNVISPGPVETPIHEKYGLTDDHKNGLASTLPAKRFGTADEMAKVALFLASDDSSFICGADISADGGAAQV